VAIGNELDPIPGDPDYDLNMWSAVNDIAQMIRYLIIMITLIFPLILMVNFCNFKGFLLG
jgi:hypothetical protein